MKRALFVFLFMLLCSTPLVFGAAITDSMEPLGNMKYAVSVEDNFIFERDLDTEGGKTEAITNDTHQIYGKITFGWTDNFNLYTKLGSVLASKYRFTTPRIYKYETGAGFLWGVGIAGMYEIMDNFKAGADVQFNSWQVDIDEVTWVGVPGLNITNTKINNYELQATGVLLYDYAMPDIKTVVSPYVALGYQYFNTETDSTISFTTANQGSATDDWDLDNEDVFLVVTGVNIKYMDNLKLSVEGRFIAETAISGGLTVLF